MSEYVPDDPIAALATPFGRSALAVIRTGGTGCIEACAALFSKPQRLRAAEGYTMQHGTLHDADGQPLDEVMLSVFRGPASYTGQDSVEIMCHGSPAGIERILDALHRSGFRPANPGEFTMRAFLNGKLDLTRAEAVQEVVSSRTSASHAMAFHRLAGSVEQRVNDLKQRLVELLARAEIQLDYPEEDTGEVVIPRETIDEVRSSLRDLVATYRTGQVYQEGVRVAIAGKTNAGKSSLFNLFLKEDRSIVSEHHGTTRDYIESELDVAGIPVRLYDTAGMRSTEEHIESEGIRRSAMVFEHADIVLYLVDATQGADEEDRSLIEAGGDKLIGVWNKTDLAQAAAGGGADRSGQPLGGRSGIPEGFLPLSAQTGAGFDALQEALRQRLVPALDESGAEPVIDSARQKQLIERCIAALDEVENGLDAGMPVDAVALDLQDAVNALGEITGEVTTADILDTMFSGFCVGK